MIGLYDYMINKLKKDKGQGALRVFSCTVSPLLLVEMLLF